MAGLVAATTATSPSLLVPSCSTSAVAGIDSIQISSGGKEFPAPTHIQACWTEDALHVRYQALADKWLKNEHSTCNSETWQQEVVELFLGDKPDPAAQYLTQYLEVEVSPQNTLYVARISNPYGNGTGKENTMIDCEASGIQHTTRMGHNSFNATLTVPWKNVYQDGKGPPGTKRGQTFYGNFFRVLMEQPVESCDPTTCDYGAWSPTFAIPPQFHITTVFGGQIGVIDKATYPSHIRYIKSSELIFNLPSSLSKPT